MFLIIAGSIRLLLPICSKTCAMFSSGMHHLISAGRAPLFEDLIGVTA